MITMMMMMMMKISNMYICMYNSLCVGGCRLYSRFVMHGRIVRMCVYDTCAAWQI